MPPCISNFRTTWRLVVTYTPWPFYDVKRASVTLSIGDWLILRAGLDDMEKLKKRHSSLPTIELRFYDRTAHSLGSGAAVCFFVHIRCFIALIMLFAGSWAYIRLNIQYIQENRFGNVNIFPLHGRGYIFMLPLQRSSHTDRVTGWVVPCMYYTRMPRQLQLNSTRCCHR
jgi:hypothetical protein